MIGPNGNSHKESLQTVNSTFCPWGVWGSGTMVTGSWKSLGWRDGGRKSERERDKEGGEFSAATDAAK